MRFVSSKQLDTAAYDVIIAGAGVVGCALAYKLSQYQLRVLLVDKRHDVCEGTTKACSSLIITGFDLEPGTLEAELVNEAASGWPDMAKKLQIPYRQCGALLVALDQQQNQRLSAIYENALKNGVNDVEILSSAQVHEKEPNLSHEVAGGLLIPREGIADPFMTCIAMVEVALENGVDILLGLNLVGVGENPDGLKSVISDDGHRMTCRYLINATGLGSWHFSRSYGGQNFHINPRRGEFFIIDKLARHLVSRILYPVPTPASRGVLVAPTIFGNLLMGPTADDLPLEMAEATGTTAEGLAAIRKGGEKLCPNLRDYSAIMTFAGLRCHCKEGSYLIRANDGMPGIITVTGIRSTGLTAAPALANYVVRQLSQECCLELVLNPHAKSARTHDLKPGWWQERPFENPSQLLNNPDYGRIICFCEQITKGELTKALDSPMRPRSIDALRRRTRAATGRCQGFNCYPKLAKNISDYCQISLDKITKCGPGSETI